MFALGASDLAFLDARARCARVVVELPAAPARVFEVLADQASWHEWCADLYEARWTSPPPPDFLGAVRVARFRFGTFEERILAWDPGRRFAFSVDACSFPIARRAAEDWRLTETSPSSTSLAWHLVVDVAPLAAAAWPAARKVAELAFRRTAAGLASKLRERGP